MRTVAIIPARLESTRLPGKPLIEINGKTMIQHVYDRVSAAPLDDCIIACDHEKIYEFVQSFGGNAVMTRKDHANGTSRIAEVAEHIEADIVLNIQCDEPLINETAISQVLTAFQDPNCQMATLKTKITDDKDIDDPNCVKVITDIHQHAIYFSRRPLPYVRGNEKIDYYKHIGIYAYRKDFLLQYTKMAQTKLELAESLEQLRVLEHGFKIKVIETKERLIGVDTWEDLERVREILKNE